MTDITTADRTLTAFFDERGAAEAAAERLRGLGLTDASIRMTGGEEYAGRAGYQEERGFWDSVLEFFFPPADSAAYAEGLRRGGYLVTVSGVPAEQYDRAVDILDPTSDCEQSPRRGSVERQRSLPTESIMARVIALCLSLALLAPASSASAAEVFLETESFADHGGWSLDTSFTHIVGSPYLLAHGLGTPVKDATTTFTVKDAGDYHLWARTKDWVAPWKAPGAPGGKARRSAAAAGICRSPRALAIFSRSRPGRLGRAAGRRPHAQSAAGQPEVPLLDPLGRHRRIRRLSLWRAGDRERELFTDHHRHRAHLAAAGRL